MKTWKKEREKDEICFKEIFEQQEMEHQENMDKEIIKLIKIYNIVINAAEKKNNVIIFGSKEKALLLKIKR